MLSIHPYMTHEFLNPGSIVQIYSVNVEKMHFLSGHDKHFWPYHWDTEKKENRMSILVQHSND